MAVQNATGCRWTHTPLRRLAQWLDSVLLEEAPDAATATVRFVSDEEMRELNRTYRGFDKSTDVLSFPGDLPPRAEAERSKAAPAESVPAPPVLPGQEPHLGDVVIAVPTAERQAAERGHGADRELRLLMLHGVLHCLGYDHEVDDGTMERVESELRRRVLPEVAA